MIKKEDETPGANAPELKPDHDGSPVGVVRMDAARSYAGVGELLQAYIDRSNQEAWNEIKGKIDYTYKHLDLALDPLVAKTDFAKELKSRLERGQKLLFKPNLVGVQNIDPQTHGPAAASTSCTEWPFVAALMRWFHDQLGVSYHQMALGEAATLMPAMASLYTLLHPGGGSVTAEATIEGRSGDFYGGWGFYFARLYLADSLAADARDDPMRGYEQSVAGTYIPPGVVTDKLMVYDLNRIFDDPTKGRRVPVPDGINFQSITLHKAVVGGDPSDPEDQEAYPGCILVNVPKLKVHVITLFTNAIKNLGIGLYPMQSRETGGHQWDYGVPYHSVPGMKGTIPHEVWVPELDPQTWLPSRDAAGRYIVNRTGGITATMIDIIQAVSSQGVLMIHIVDGIEAINVDHTGSGLGQRAPEGMVFAGLDPVATDLLCARYLFSNVPLKEAMKVNLDDGHGGRFPQKVPIAALEGGQIVTRVDYDCPLSRDISFTEAEKQGLGRRTYHVVGHDVLTDSPLVSVQGHLGTIAEGRFSDVNTRTLFFAMAKMPWDLQKTALSYLEAVDQMEGTSLKQDFLKALDEDGDGVVSYEEFGRKGMWGSLLYLGGMRVARMATERLGYLRSTFGRVAAWAKYGDPSLNPDGHDVFRDLLLEAIIHFAYQKSQSDSELVDPFVRGLTYGQGKWPSYRCARHDYMGEVIYGRSFPHRVAFPSLYASAFLYADLTQNGGQYGGLIRTQPNTEGINQYIADVVSRRVTPLNFIVYVPAGFDRLGDGRVPHMEVTVDPMKILTASFADGREVWLD